MKKVRFGITGSGYMGRTHAESIKQLGDAGSLVAVYGGSRAPALAAMSGAACEPTLEALMARRDIDAVVITTPHHLHFKEVMLALESGKHVLIEKPIATKLEDCDRMLELAKRQGLFVGSAYNSRFRTNPPKARELIRSGAIGQVQSIHYSMIRRMDDNFGGNKFAWVALPETVGFIIDGLPHGIDMLRWFMGAEIVKVSGLSRTFLPNRPIEDTSVGLMEFSNGAISSFHSTIAAHGAYPREGTRISIIGSKALIDMDAFGEMHLSDVAGGWRHVSTQPMVPFDQPEAAFTSLGRMQAFHDQMRAFVDGIHGRPTEVGTGVDGRAGVEVCLALLRSSAEGTVITLPAKK